MLRPYPDDLHEIEYEIEGNSDPAYGFDVVDAGGHRFKIEVSAITGEIIQGHVEDWAIGREPDAQVHTGRQCRTPFAK